MTGFIDTHAHLCDNAFDEDRWEIVEKSFSSAVERIVEISCQPADWEKGREICAKYKGSIFAAFGIHPDYAGREKEEDIEKLCGYLKKDFCLGVGEIGLDYYWEPGKKEEQLVLLEKMLDISNKMKLPAVFHVRNSKNAPDGNAYSDLSRILKDKWTFENKKAKRGIFHCFSGTYEDAARALGLGNYIGINGTFTYKGNWRLREVVKKIGIKNIVLETDCPYLPPEGKRGKRNDPTSIPVIAGAVAESLNMSPEKVAEITFQNAEIFFER